MIIRILNRGFSLLHDWVFLKGSRLGFEPKYPFHRQVQVRVKVRAGAGVRFRARVGARVTVRVSILPE